MCNVELCFLLINLLILLLADLLRNVNSLSNKLYVMLHVTLRSNSITPYFKFYNLVIFTTVSSGFSWNGNDAVILVFALGSGSLEL